MGPNGYRLALHGTLPGLLPLLAFEGATQRTKPQLKVGDAVYCRVAAAPGDMEPTLSCAASSTSAGSRKGWETGEATFGPLAAGGTVLRAASLESARSLRRHDHPVVAALEEERVAFELAAGDNGVVWVRAATPPLTIAVANAVQNGLALAAMPGGSEKVARATIAAMVKDIIGRVRKQPD